MNLKIIQLKSVQNRHWYFNKVFYACVGYLCLFLLCSCANEGRFDSKGTVNETVPLESNKQLKGLSVAGLKLEIDGNSEESDTEIEKSIMNTVV